MFEIIENRLTNIAVAPEPSPPSILYHYTNVAAFKSIIETGQLWLTDVRYLNDSKEIDYPLKLILEVIPNVAKTAAFGDPKWLMEYVEPFRNFLNTFLISLSNMDDDAAQWLNYGKGEIPIALGFDCRELIDANGTGVSLIPMEYDRTKQEAAIGVVAQEIFSAHTELRASVAEDMDFEFRRRFSLWAAGVFWWQAFRFKSKHWAAEQEWRLMTGGGFETTGKSMRFRTSPALGLIPYLEITPRHRKGEFHSKLPIREVVVGPSIHQDLAVDAIQRFLSLRSYQSPLVTVRRSDLAIRR